MEETKPAADVVVTETEATATATEEIKEQAEAEVAAETKPTSPKPGEPEYTRKVQERINEITRERRTAEREAARLKAENEALKKKLAAGARPVPPDPSKFADGSTGEINWTKYNEAVVHHEDKLHTWQQAQEVPTTPAQEEDSSDIMEAFKRFNESSNRMREKHDDFDKVINRDDVFTLELIPHLYQSDFGPEIAYSLGKNPSEALRIGNLPPALMLKELGKLEAKFAAPVNPRAVSTAPAPITPVQPTATAPTKDLSKVQTPEEYAAIRRAQLDEERKKRPYG